MRWASGYYNYKEWSPKKRNNASYINGRQRLLKICENKNSCNETVFRGKIKIFCKINY